MVHMPGGANRHPVLRGKIVTDMLPNEDIKVGRRFSIVSDIQELLKINSETGVAAAVEARRLAEKYNKDFLNCDDLAKIIGVGKNNVRQLMNSHDFPTIEIGNRKVVSVIAFAMWSMIHTN